MSEILTFQDAIFRLQRYWAEKGCLLWQPYNTEVGAGTMNPATFLRVLGPEPWNVGYVEPSVRPDDSRYGDNPNRIQMHTQYQVILKPDPGNPQELYLDSLEALGIDRSVHDIRFVEDNWESPALGAWGLGWEVWLDGMEITQFTYFQQAGGFPVDPVAVELTYGMERIMMALQGVNHFRDILYAPGITYGEVLGQNEYEMSVYNLDEADTDRVNQLFLNYESEAQMLLDKRLPIPAYSYLLKTSHTFNILDARGAVGVTERARFFARMRDLARRVSALWLERREELEYPLGETTFVAAQQDTLVDAHEATPQTFLLEIGSEELPAADVTSAASQLRKSLPALLDSLRLDYGEVYVGATPRRLSAIVQNLAPRQRDEEREVKGPPARIAFDAEGAPTKAAVGFAKKTGADPAALERREIDGGEYVVATVKETGRPTGEALANALPQLVAGISFPKSMRWNASGVTYSRPLRWFVCLFGEVVVPFVYAGLASNRVSRGLRNGSQLEFSIGTVDEYATLLEANQIVLDAGRRREAIWASAQKLAQEVGGRVPESARGDLLDEVANLVEHPNVLRGEFEAKYLALPREVLVTVMRKHQRYFPVENEKGELAPYFIAVPNGTIDVEAVRRGNEAVLRARYANAEFFWKNDTAKPLESFLPKLNGLTFQAKLGSMLEKNKRLETLTPQVGKRLGLSEDDLAVAVRAAALAKADLATEMVVELTSLAGIMGRHYALRSGESEDVARAIFEHVLPRFAGDALPETKAGVALAVADRLDSLTGLFAVGLAPKSAADPFALRRASLGIVQTLVERDLDLDLSEAVHAAAEQQPVDVPEQIERDVLEFVVRRFEQWLLERGGRHDLVQAILSARGSNPATAARALCALAAVADSEEFKTILTAYSRPARIVRGQETADEVNAELFEHEEECALWAACQTAAQAISPEMPLGDFLEAFRPLTAPIDRFFDEVFVMVEDERVKRNRLALLGRIAGLSAGIIDLTKIEGF